MAVMDCLHGAQGPKGEPGPVARCMGLQDIKASQELGEQLDHKDLLGRPTYVRWGNSSCPNVAGTELVYSGRAGGSYFFHKGYAANYLCMPLDPEYTLSLIRLELIATIITFIYGAEYESPIQGIHQHNVPCAVCAISTREMVLMIPAKTSCPTSWTREYSNYGCLLMPMNTIDPCTHDFCIERGQESL